MAEIKDKNFVLFLSAVAAEGIGLGFGLGGAFASNFYHEAYGIGSLARGALEIPREIPAILCVFTVAWIVRRGSILGAAVSQLLCAFAMIIMGFWTPPFPVLAILIAINAFGIHTYYPLHNTIIMRLGKEDDDSGRRMGASWCVNLASGAIVGVIVFFGFKHNLFSFSQHLKWTFFVSGAMYITTFLLFMWLRKRIGDEAEHKKVKIGFNKKYGVFYYLALLGGMQSQMGLVFIPWLIITILGKGADFMAILMILVFAVSSFGAKKIGKWTDKIGVAKMLRIGGYSYTVLNTAGGVMALGFVFGWLPANMFWVCAVSVLMIVMRLVLQSEMARFLILNEIEQDKRELPKTFAAGASLSHLSAMTVAFGGGWIWAKFGSWWVFFAAALLSFGNIICAKMALKKSCNNSVTEM